MISAKLFYLKQNLTFHNNLKFPNNLNMNEQNMSIY